jgi:hypothetical protein
VVIKGFYFILINIAIFSAPFSEETLFSQCMLLAALSKPIYCMVWINFWDSILFHSGIVTIALQCVLTLGVVMPPDYFFSQSALLQIFHMNFRIF